MQSPTSHHKAVELVTQSINDLHKSGLSLADAGSFVWKCLQYPGQLLDQFRTSKPGKVLIKTTIAATGAMLIRRVFDYALGRTTNPLEVFSFPRQRTLNDLVGRFNVPRAAQAAVLNNLVRWAGARYGKRMYSRFTKDFKRYRQHKLHVPKSHFSYTVPSIVKTGATTLGSVGLGTVALKYAARFFRRLLHRN